MKIVCSLATFKSREGSLKMTLDSLRSQSLSVDVLFVYDNELFPDLTDNGKFWILSQIKEPVIFFSMDDDIIYPDDYIEKSVAALKKNPKAIITYHGRKLVGRGLQYYKSHVKYRCTEQVKSDRYIDVAGSGVSCFNTKYFNPSKIHSCPDRKMTDLVLSYEAAKEGVKILCKKHSSGWINSTGVSEVNSIYAQLKNNCETQGQYADKILDLL